jgi:hypothetical protein
MVRLAASRNLWLDEDGISMTEAMLVTPIVLFFVTFMVEMSVAVFHWNQTIKAVQVGSRYVSVSTPLMTRATYQTNMTSDYGSINQGNPTPIAALSTACGAGTTPCDTALMGRLLTGGDGVCGNGSAMVGMCDIAPWITTNNVLVTYSRSGLGYVGRPFGAVTTITVEVRNVSFNFMILDKMMPILNTITHPPHKASTTSEDLSNCDVLC